MKYKENCIVRKGYFPETAEDLEDEFVFVSIDADLYEPIYNGLCYFYP
jgi:O-methyltransferase